MRHSWRLGQGSGKHSCSLWAVSGRAAAVCLAAGAGLAVAAQSHGFMDEGLGGGRGGGCCWGLTLLLRGLCDLPRVGGLRVLLLWGVEVVDLLLTLELHVEADEGLHGGYMGACCGGLGNVYLQDRLWSRDVAGTGDAEAFLGAIWALRCVEAGPSHQAAQERAAAVPVQGKDGNGDWVRR